MPRGSTHIQRGKANEQRILRCLAESPKTVKALASALGMKGSNLAIYITRLRYEPKRIYRCGHEQRNGSPAPVWAVGTLPDVEYVPLECPTPKPTATERKLQVLTILEAGPLSTRQLAGRMFLAEGVVGRYIKALRDPEAKQLYICKWLHPSEANPESKGGHWTPLYAIGDKPDKKMPKKETSAQRHKRLQKEKTYRDDRKAKSKAAYTLKKARSLPTGIFAALGL
jgi:DNA-binding CsgD family transcriptional regulator